MIWKYFEIGVVSTVVLVRLIGVNKGRRVTLKYFIILIKVSRKHRLFLAPGQSIILICVVVK